MKYLRKGMLIILLVSAFLLQNFVVFLQAAVPQPQYGGSLTVSDVYDGVSIGYPPKIPMVYSNRQAAPAVETLLRINKAGMPVPWLATAFKEDAKTRTITLTIRKGVKFHDGTDLNAEAVKWNLDQSIAAKSPGTNMLKSIDIIGDYGVRMNLSEWDSTVTPYLAQTLGMIISPTACKKNGEEWCAAHPVGTGPFEFVSWEKDTRTVYKKFSGYWQKGKPYLDRIEFVPIMDTLTRQMGLKRGEIDVGMTMDSKDLAPLEKDGYKVIRGRMGSGAETLIPDAADPKSPFADIRVRQAAQHAIDSQALVKAIYYGEAEASNQWGYKEHWGYNPTVKGYPYNPAKARELLAKAGYPNGFKTKIFFRTSPQNDQLFTAVQGQLKAVGIDAELELATTGRFTQVTQKSGNWEGLAQGGWWSYPDITAGLAIRFSGGGTFYIEMLKPDDYVKAIEGAVSAPDFETKKRRTQEAMKLMIDKYCSKIILFVPRAGVVTGPKIHDTGFYATPNAGLWTPEDAWREKK